MGMTLKDRIAQMKAKAEANSNSADRIINLKDGNYTVALRMPKGRVWDKANPEVCEDFFQEYTVDFSKIANPKYENNGPKTYYAVPAIILEATDSSLVNKDKIVYIRLNNTMLLQLLSRTSSFKDLFNPGTPVVSIWIGQRNSKWACDIEVDPDVTWEGAGTHPESSIEEATKWAAGEAKDKQAGGDADVKSFA